MTTQQKGKDYMKILKTHTFDGDGIHKLKPSPAPSWEERLQDAMADFMTDLCEQKRHDEHICQPPDALWKKNWKRFTALLTSATEAGRKEERERKISEDYGFYDLVAMVKQMLINYPRDVFTGVSGDKGPRFIAALYKALDILDSLQPKKERK